MCYYKYVVTYVTEMGGNMRNLFESVHNYENYLIYREYNKGQLLFNEGDICEYVGIILEGSISISTLTYGNREQEINHLYKNDLFGENLLFSNDKKYLGDIIAEEKTKIALISKENFLILLSNKTILNNYLEINATMVLKMQQKAKLLSQKNIKDKILFYLTEEVKRTNNKRIIIKSKEELAKYLNIPRPSLSRELISLKSDNIINYDKNSITLK